MILCILSQSELEYPFALFESIEEGREFFAKLPGYNKHDEEIEGYAYTYETLDPKELSVYQEIEFNGNRVPFTRFMFSFDEDVDLYWQELPNLHEANQGLVQGGTKVDAYYVDNNEVEAYIGSRERGYQRISEILSQLGYIAGRNHAGSEDGEAIVYRKKGEDEERILAYLDPEFLEIADYDDEKLQEWVKGNLSI